MDYFRGLGLSIPWCITRIFSPSLFAFTVLCILVELSIEPVACRRRHVFSIGVGMAPLRKRHSYDYCFPHYLNPSRFVPIYFKLPP